MCFLFPHLIEIAGVDLVGYGGLFLDADLVLDEQVYEPVAVNQGDGRSPAQERCIFGAGAKIARRKQRPLNGVVVIQRATQFVDMAPLYVALFDTPRTKVRGSTSPSRALPQIVVERLARLL